MSIQNLCGFSSLPRRLFLSVSVPTFELQRREIFSCCKKVFGSGARRGGGRRACCTHFLATDTPGSQLPHRQECASSTPGRCRIHPPASQRWVGVLIPPLAKARPIWLASPPSLVLQLTHRLAATTAYQYTILGGWELWAGTSHTPRLPLGAIKCP